MHDVLGIWAADGAVVLARDRLVFTPWDVDETRAWLERGLGWAGVPQGGDVDRLFEAADLVEPVTIPLGAVVSVELDSGPRLGLADGRHLDVAIEHGAEDFARKLSGQRRLLAATAPAQRAPAVEAAPIAYDGPVNPSPMARNDALEQLREWRKTLTPAEFAVAKARKLAEVGLVAGRPPQAVHGSPRMAVEQANELALLVAEGVLTEAEYQTVRRVILHDNGLA